MKLSTLNKIISEMIESAIEEAVYPEGFDVAAFKALPSFAARIKYVKQRLPKVAQGSARAVFIVDENTVLKVAMNAKGKAQNNVEADLGRAGYYPVAHVYEVGDDGVWIEMEKAQKITTKTFKQVSGMPFDRFAEIILYFDAERNGKNHYWDKPEGYDEIWDEGIPLIKEIMDLIGNYDMPGGDIARISSWGIVARDGKQELVLIDFGLTKSVWDDYYAPKNKQPIFGR